MEAVDAALGRSHRTDPVSGSSGGPAGNGRLTAWTGLMLLVLFVAELVTLLDVRGLISWHLALGVVLVPPALLKTATTGWRIVRYYTGHEPYRQAGPPPALLRILGPLVIVASLALLATGVALVLLGERSSRQSLVAVLGLHVDTLTLHKGAFVAWAATTGLHVLARIWPAWRITRPGRPRVPGRRNRGVALLAMLALSVALAGWVLTHQNGWDSRDRAARPPGDAISR
ncbi:MAG: hypothetical protein ABI934_10665 [Actinomycetota bacterium]